MKTRGSVRGLVALVLMAAVFGVWAPGAEAVLPPFTSNLTLHPSTIPADGVSTSLAVLTLNGPAAVLSGDADVTITTSGDAVVGPVVNHRNGTYTAIIRASRTASYEFITGTATRLGFTQSNTQALVETPWGDGPAVLDLSIAPHTAEADGEQLITATALARDSAGNGVSGLTVDFAWPYEAVTQVSGPTDMGNGEYVAEFRAGTEPRPFTITAHVVGTSLSATRESRLTSYLAMPTMALPESVPADGESTVRGLVSVTEHDGTPRWVSSIDVWSDGDAQILYWARTADVGVYEFFVRSSTTPGDEVVCARVPDSEATSCAVLRETPISPDEITSVYVSVDPQSIDADGVSTATVTARTFNGRGEQVSGGPVTMHTSFDTTVGPVTDHGDGVYTATLTASTTSGWETVYATAANGIRGDAWVYEKAGPPQSIVLDLWNNEVVADGQSQGYFSVYVYDQYGNLVTDTPPVSASVDGDITINYVDWNGSFFWGSYTASTTPGVETLTVTLMTNGASDSDQITELGSGGGYWMVAEDGGVFAFGDARFYGSMGGVQLPAPIAEFAGTPGKDGYWMLGENGAVYPFGAALHHGDLAGAPLQAPVVAIRPTPSGNGYWITLANGAVHQFGDANDYGDVSAIRLNQPIVDMAPAESGHGYWLVAADGGVFAFGEAQYFGSHAGAGAHDVVGIQPAPGGNGYWIAQADGIVYHYGAAADVGNAPDGGPISDIDVDEGNGGVYLRAGADVVALSGADHYGDMGDHPLIVPIAAFEAF